MGNASHNEDAFGRPIVDPAKKEPTMINPNPYYAGVTEEPVPDSPPVQVEPNVQYDSLAEEVSVVDSINSVIEESGSDPKRASEEETLELKSERLRKAVEKLREAKAANRNARDRANAAVEIDEAYRDLSTAIHSALRETFE